MALSASSAASGRCQLAVSQLLAHKALQCLTTLWTDQLVVTVAVAEVVDAGGQRGCGHRQSGAITKPEQSMTCSFRNGLSDSGRPDHRVADQDRAGQRRLSRAVDGNTIVQQEFFNGQLRTNLMTNGSGK